MYENFQKRSCNIKVSKEILGIFTEKQCIIILYQSLGKKCIE